MTMIGFMSLSLVRAAEFSQDPDQPVRVNLDDMPDHRQRPQKPGQKPPLKEQEEQEDLQPPPPDMDPQEQQALAEQTFEALYAQDIAQVKRTRDEQDDLAMARKLMHATQDVSDSPYMQKMLYQAVVDLAIVDLQGNELAMMAANRLLPKLDSDQRIATLEKILDQQEDLIRSLPRDDKKLMYPDYVDTVIRLADEMLYQGQYKEAQMKCRRSTRYIPGADAGYRDAIQQRVREAGEMRMIENKVEMLERRLDSDPMDEEAAEELAMILITERDDPQAAAEIVPRRWDQELAGHVDLATLPLDQLDAEQALRLADWYNSLVEQTSALMRVVMIRRAMGYYDYFLQKHPRQDALHLKANTHHNELAERYSQILAARDVERIAVWPEDAERFAGHYYKMYQEHMTWREARDYCAKQGGYLVAINSPQENEFVKNLVKGVGDAWIGGSDARREGLWIWTNGKPMRYTNWAPGEPNDAGDQDFAYMYAHAGNWDDRGEHAEASCFVCEWEP